MQIYGRGRGNVELRSCLARRQASGLIRSIITKRKNKIIQLRGSGLRLGRLAVMWAAVPRQLFQLLAGSPSTVPSLYRGPFGGWG